LEEFLEFHSEVRLKYLKKKGHEYYFGSFRGELQQQIVTRITQNIRLSADILIQDFRRCSGLGTTVAEPVVKDEYVIKSDTNMGNYNIIFWKLATCLCSPHLIETTAGQHIQVTDTDNFSRPYWSLAILTF
jgi:hypothetical protein